MRNGMRFGCRVEACTIHAHGHNVHRRCNSGGHKSALVEFTGHPDLIHLVAARHPICGQAFCLKHGAADVGRGLRVAHKGISGHMHHAAKGGVQLRAGEFGQRCLRLRAQLGHKCRHGFAHGLEQHTVAARCQVGGERACIIGVTTGFKDGRMPAHRC